MHHNFTFEINPFDDQIVKFYPYRTARLGGWIVKIHLTDDDLWFLRHELEDYGFKLDNHIVFTTHKSAFFVSDHYMYVGTLDSVREGSY